MLMPHPYKIFETRNVCDYMTKHVGEPQATHEVIVVYGELPSGKRNFEKLELCAECAEKVKQEALRYGYEVDVRKIDAKTKVIKQINNLKIKYDANCCEYQVWSLDKRWLETFFTLMAAEKFCKNTTDFVR
jgi:hypothetical protein